MIDLQFVGYTADLKHLVFDLDAGSGEGRYRLRVDADLFATIDTLRDARRALELPVGDELEFIDQDVWEDDLDDDEAGDDSSEGTVDDLDDEASDTSTGAWLTDEEDDDGHVEEPTDVGLDGDDVDDDGNEADGDATPVAIDGEEGEGVSDGPATALDPAAEIRARAARPGLDARGGDGPSLSPLEIQSLLRQGRSTRAVARAANTTVDWVENWLGPIEAEREQITRAARRARLERSRLGVSRDPMGTAVDRHLRDRGLAVEDVHWEAARRKDGRWRVSVVFVHRRRRTKASWLYDPASGTLKAANDAGGDLGFVRRKQRA